MRKFCQDLVRLWVARGVWKIWGVWLWGVNKDLKSYNRVVFWMPVNGDIIDCSWIQSWGDKGAFGRDMYIFRACVSGVKLRNVPKQATCFMDMGQWPSSLWPGAGLLEKQFWILEELQTEITLFCGHPSIMRSISDFFVDWCDILTMTRFALI